MSDLILEIGSANEGLLYYNPVQDCLAVVAVKKRKKKVKLALYIGNHVTTIMGDDYWYLIGDFN